LPILLPANPLTINDVADVADFPDLHINLAFLGLLIVILILILIPDLEICAHLCQSVATSKMLPPVAAVLPVEKLNETLVK
jgi:hypothetical protein